jgi:hypothetical protein
LQNANKVVFWGSTQPNLKVKILKKKEKEKEKNLPNSSKQLKI